MKKTDLIRWSSFLLVLSGVLTFGSCNNEDSVETKDTTDLVGTDVFVDVSATSSLRCATSNPTPHSYCGEQKTITLLAGQNINVGSITISNDGENLYVRYETINGWVIRATHLYVGPLENVPDNKSGNPKVGKFPYKEIFIPCVTSYEYVIPLVGLGEDFIVAAHADVLLLNNGRCTHSGPWRVLQQETAWGDGERFVDRGSWATYATYKKQECEDCIYTPSVFNFYRPTTNVTGNITVTNDDTYLYVTFNIDDVLIPEMVLYNSQLYVGTLADIPLGINGVPDPQLFPEQRIHDPHVKTYTYMLPLSGLPSCYIIAAHAKVCSVEAWGFGGTEYSFKNLFGIDTWGWVINYCTQVCP